HPSPHVHPQLPTGVRANQSRRLEGHIPSPSDHHMPRYVPALESVPRTTSSGGQPEYGRASAAAGTKSGCGNEGERMEVILVDGPSDAAHLLADTVEDCVAHTSPTSLGVATGSTPVAGYS